MQNKMVQEQNISRIRELERQLDKIIIYLKKPVEDYEANGHARIACEEKQLEYFELTGRYYVGGER